MFLSRRWRQQPRGPVSVDAEVGPWAFAWTASFDALAGGAERSGAVSYTVTGGTQRKTPTSGGLAANLSFDSEGFGYTRDFVRFLGTESLLLSRPCTLWYYGRFLSTDSNSFILESYDTPVWAGGSDNNRVELAGVGGGSWGIRVVGNTGTTYTAAAGAATGLKMLVGTHDGANIRFFENGALLATTACSEFPASSRPYAWRTGGYPGRYGAPLAHAIAAGVIRRALSPAEVAALGPTPWQLFRPRTLRIYSLPASGIPVLSLPGVQDITSTSARLKVTLTF